MRVLLVTIAMFFIAATAIAKEYPLQTGDDIVYARVAQDLNIPVWTHEPPDSGADNPVLIVMHGNGRDADRYLHQWRALSDQYGFYLVVPEFSREHFPKGTDYNLGKVFSLQDGEQQLNPRSRWSYSFIEPVFDVAIGHFGIEATHYDIYGHSAGAQFVHRFLYHVPDARVNRYVVANAGWYTMPYFGEEWPYGLAKSALKEGDINHVFSSPLTILLGDQDTDPNHRSLRRAPEAMRQGEHRFARGHYFYHSASLLAKQQRVQFNWQRQAVPGIAHDNGGMAEVAARVLYGGN